MVAFPDDDCRYPPDLLMRVARFLRDTGADGIAGRPVDDSGRPSSGCWRDESCLIEPVERVALRDLVHDLSAA